jgi:hypothetical protein
VVSIALTNVHYSFHFVSWFNIMYIVSSENYTLCYLCMCTYFLVLTYLLPECRGMWKLKVFLQLIECAPRRSENTLLLKGSRIWAISLNSETSLQNILNTSRSDKVTVWQVFKRDHSDSDKQGFACGTKLTARMVPAAQKFHAEGGYQPIYLCILYVEFIK